MENQNQPTSEATPATHNPDLSAVPVDALISEIYRRHHKGECVALVITPDDVSEEWECDDSGATSPASRVPESEDEMKAIRYAFDHWIDLGGYSEVMQTLRDAWNDELDRKAKGDAK